MNNKLIKTKWHGLCKYVLNKDFLVAIIVSVTIICGGLFLGWYNNKVVPVSQGLLSHYTGEPHKSLSFVSDWDGPDYISISKDGYSNINNANFFPLYPLLIHYVNKVLDSDLYSALLISWVCLVGAVYFYLKIIKKLFNVKNKEALLGVLLFVLFPTAVFLLATYTESLFAFLALGAIYFALQKKYLPSVIFAMFATATHITGIFLLILLGLILYEQKEKILEIFLFLVIGSVGILSYMYYLLVEYNRPLAFITAQKSHGWVQLHHSSYIHNLETTSDIFNVIFVGLLVAAVIYWWNRKKSFSIYSFTFLLIPLVGGQFGGFDRYTLMAFPVQFMLFERFRKRTLAYSVTLAAFAIIWTYTLLQYMGGYTGS